MNETVNEDSVTAFLNSHDVAFLNTNVKYHYFLCCVGAAEIQDG